MEVLKSNLKTRKTMSGRLRRETGIRGDLQHAMIVAMSATTVGKIAKAPVL